MTLTDLASIGSFISAIAVAVTLVFLVVQTRQTNKNQRALMQQGRSAKSVALLMEMTQPHMNQLLVRADRNDLTLESSDVLAFFRLCGAWFWNYEDSYLQFHAGTLDSSGWEADLAALKSILAAPGARIAWKFVRRYQAGEYHDFVDALVREIKVVQPLDFSAFWRDHMAEELAALAATPSTIPNITAAPPGTAQ